MVSLIRLLLVTWLGLFCTVAALATLSGTLISSPLAALFLRYGLAPLPYLACWTFLVFGSPQRAVPGIVKLVAASGAITVLGLMVTVASFGVLAIPMLLGGGIALGRVLESVHARAEPGADMREWGRIHFLGGFYAALGLLAADLISPVSLGISYAASEVVARGRGQMVWASIGAGVATSGFIWHALNSWRQSSREAGTTPPAPAIAWQSAAVCLLPAFLVWAVTTAQERQARLARMPPITAEERAERARLIEAGERRSAENVAAWGVSGGRTPRPNEPVRMSLRDRDTVTIAAAPGWRVHLWGEWIIWRPDGPPNVVAQVSLTPQWTDVAVHPVSPAQLRDPPSPYLFTCGISVPSLPGLVACRPWSSTPLPGLHPWSALVPEGATNAVVELRPRPPGSGANEPVLLAWNFAAQCRHEADCDAVFPLDGGQVRATFPYAMLTRWREVRPEVATLLHAALGMELEDVPVAVQPEGELLPLSLPTP